MPSLGREKQRVPVKLHAVTKMCVVLWCFARHSGLISPSRRCFFLVSVVGHGFKTHVKDAFPRYVSIDTFPAHLHL